jgi:hypothetical protein
MFEYAPLLPGFRFYFWTLASRFYNFARVHLPVLAFCLKSQFSTAQPHTTQR